ncbi:MAG: hypothetical protein ACTSUB_10330 [Candidatus Thorarchaeota archaeon]
MINHNIQALLLMDKGGVPLFFIKLDPKASDIDPFLISGFFAALDHFSGEVVESGSKIFQIDYGARLFTVVSSKETNLVSISMGEWDDEIIPIHNSIIEEFETDWLKMATENKIESDLQSHLPRFRESVLSKIAFRHVSVRWTPRYVTTQETDPSGWESSLVELIDGVVTVGEIIAKSGLPGEDVLEEIGRLWAQNSIRFRNVLEGSDIVISTSKMRKVFQHSSADKAKIEDERPGILTLLPRLSSLLDGRRTITQVTEELAGFQKEQVNEALDFFFDRGTIEILSPEKRRIQVVKAAFELILEVSENVYSKKVTKTALDIAAKNIRLPEVSGEIPLSHDSWKIYFEMELLEGLDPTRLMEIYAEWMSLAARFVSNLEEKKLAKCCAELFQAFQEKLLDTYHPADFKGLEEISFWLEMITSSKEK